VLTLLALGVATIGVASSGGASRQVSPAGATLTATGTAAATFVPDVANLSFGSSVDRQKADVAISANAAVMTKVIDALKNAGARDLGTDAVSLTILHPLNDPTTITGFEASNIVHATTSVDQMGALIDAAVAAGAQGIVSAGTGAGRPTPREDEALDRAVAQGVVVCQSSRVGSGRVVRAPSLVKRGMVAADNLVPWKARALLSLALTRTHDPAEIQRMFDEY
jgi:uncharacterized protein YggE